MCLSVNLALNEELELSQTLADLSFTPNDNFERRSVRIEILCQYCCSASPHQHTHPITYVPTYPAAHVWQMYGGSLMGRNKQEKHTHDSE